MKKPPTYCSWCARLIRWYHRIGWAVVWNDTLPRRLHRKCARKFKESTARDQDHALSGPCPNFPQLDVGHYIRYSPGLGYSICVHCGARYTP